MDVLGNVSCSHAEACTGFRLQGCVRNTGSEEQRDGCSLAETHALVIGPSDDCMRQSAGSAHSCGLVTEGALCNAEESSTDACMLVGQPSPVSVLMAAGWQAASGQVLYLRQVVCLDSRL